MYIMYIFKKGIYSHGGNNVTQQVDGLLEMKGMEKQKGLVSTIPAPAFLRFVCISDSHICDVYLYFS